MPPFQLRRRTVIAHRDRAAARLPEPCAGSGVLEIGAGRRPEGADPKAPARRRRPEGADPKAPTRRRRPEGADPKAPAQRCWSTAGRRPEDAGWRWALSSESSHSDVRASGRRLVDSQRNLSTRSGTSRLAAEPRLGVYQQLATFEAGDVDRQRNARR